MIKAVSFEDTQLKSIYQKHLYKSGYEKLNVFTALPIFLEIVLHFAKGNFANKQKKTCKKIEICKRNYSKNLCNSYENICRQYKCHVKCCTNFTNFHLFIIEGACIFFFSKCPDGIKST